jgi:four helix bundle protein
MKGLNKCELGCSQSAKDLGILTNWHKGARAQREIGTFLELRVWQLAKELAIKIYKLTSNPTFSKDFGLKDQIQRSAVSIPSNIAEGDELDTDRQSVRYFYIAKGSTAEVLTQLIIAEEIGYIDTETMKILVNDCKIISVMLTKLIKARSK